MRWGPIGEGYTGGAAEAKSGLEDYLQVIYGLINDKGHAGTVEIAEKLRVKSPSVSGMLQRLAVRGYLVHEPYRGVRLTDKGVRIARSVVKGHNMILELLMMLGMDDKVAYQDTEGIEHHIQPETISRIGGSSLFCGKTRSYWILSGTTKKNRKSAA